jgi:H+/Cl- antiporter ClcA
VLGALFGSPVAAALLLTEIVGALKRGGVLWDRLFAPMVAAASAAVVAVYFREDLILPDLADYRMTNLVDLFSGSVIAVIAAALGVGAAVLFPLLHKVLHSLRHPVLYLGVGGLVLGLLGVLGGPITLFKGAHQAVELVEDADTLSAGQLTMIALVKIAALLIAGAASFRGGRIFPALFIGIALGLLAHDLVPAVPQTLAVCAATLGFVMAVSRDGWLALFMAAILAGGGEVLIPLCVIILPVWLVVARAPEMIVPKPKPAESASEAATAPAKSP